MSIESLLQQAVAQAVQQLFGENIPPADVNLQETNKDFAGDITVVVFPFVRMARKSPEQTGAMLGEYLKANVSQIADFNVIKGFLNLEISDSYWLDFFNKEKNNLTFGKGKGGQNIVLEYCGPNTNKPLHLGHIRNMLIGYATASLLEYAGHEVHKVNIYNDRGIAICKSMLAWQKFGEGKTPQSEGIKGDHFVGDFYVKFDVEYKKEVEQLMASGQSKEEAEKNSQLINEAREMLRLWEAGDAETVALWNKMNNWVYEGFEQTFQSLGVDFEKHYKESEYYERGKELVLEGLKNDCFYKKEDGSVWVDLEADGLDHKLLLRNDGTSVYITQDMGIAEARYNDYKFDQSIYVVANEQDYHFKVLQLVLQKLQKPYAEGIYHLSYGMVDLPEGRMKSREGTVVDADDLIQEMIETAEQHTRELGKIDDLSPAQADELFKTLAMGALKYFILKVNPRKRVIFNPKESIDFQGNTGPFIQYAHARIQSILRRQNVENNKIENYTLKESEKELLKELHKFPEKINEGAKNYDISEVANFAYELARTYNKFYASEPILSAAGETEKQFRLQLSAFTAHTLKTCLKLMGIDAPDKM
jgi:arginyl-tRNA synthetase